MNLNDAIIASIPRVCLVNANTDSYPLVHCILKILREKLNNTTYHTLTADRYFNYSTVTNLIKNGNLFDNGTSIEINYQSRPSLEHQKKIINIIDELDQTTYLIITTDKLTKNDYNSTWIKKINSIGWSLSINEEDTNIIVKYQLKQFGISIDKIALDTLQQLNQSNISQLLQAVKQLTLLYPSGYKISSDEIKEHSFDNSQYNIYQLSNAYLSANKKQSLKILDNTYQKTEDAILLLWFLAEDVKKLIRFKGRLQQNQPFKRIAEELRIWGNVLPLWQEATRRLSYPTLVQLLDNLAILDATIKGILKGDVRLQLISIITQLCSK